jgi:protocatechuate 3,4-dioxygenase beta subunit
VLGDYVQSGDPGSPALPDGQSSVTLSGADNLDQDFGYTAPSQGLGSGGIGDTVFLDSNGNNAFDVGEGIQGVTVNLFEADGSTLVASTTTDANGNYLFGGLDSTATYVVKVGINSLPNSGAGLTNSVDPNDDGTTVPGTGDSASTHDLSAVGGIDLDADFGYIADVPNRIGGTVWDDANADGTLTETGAGIPGVTVDLYEDVNGNDVIDAGDRLIGTTVTDANGDYGFDNLPDGNYLVDVTATDNVLDGYWHSDGPNDGLDNNSQVDPYPVSVTGGVDDTTGDFGYYRGGAALGNRAWIDTDNNGLQDDGELGLAGVEITLLITYPNGDTSTVVTTTDANGAYSFANLLADESYSASTAGDPEVDGLPRFEISAELAPAGYFAGNQIDRGDGKNDGDSPNGVTAASIARGDTDMTVIPDDPGSESDEAAYDFAYVTDTTVFVISGVVYDDVDGDGDLGDRESQGGDETGLAGATVQLFTDPNGDGDPSDGEQVGSNLTSGVDGSYEFTGVPPGNYVIVETNPTDYSSTNDIVTPNDDRIPVSVTDSNRVEQDFLDSQNPDLPSISGQVREDADGDGELGDPDDGLSGVTIELWSDPDGDPRTDDGVLVATTTTDADGNYSFPDVGPGNYTVRETNPDGYTSTNDTDSPNDDRIGVVLLPSQDSEGNDFLDALDADAQVAPISGRVIEDVDVDRDLDERFSEPGIGGVTIELWIDTNGNGRRDSSDILYDTTTTDADGNYSFPAVPPGDYVVVEQDPSGFFSTNDVDGGRFNQIAVTRSGTDPVTDADFLDARGGGGPGPTPIPAVQPWAIPLLALLLVGIALRSRGLRRHG